MPKMTREEILAMKAGRELNIRVAEDVMGFEFSEDEIFGDTESYKLSRRRTPLARFAGNQIYGPLRHYSEDMSAAQRVVDKLKKYNVRLEFNHHTENWEAWFSHRKADFSYPIASAVTIPEAICKAALLTMLEVKNE